MDDVLLQIPGFARLADYLGIWCIEPQAAAALREIARSMDLSAHIAQKPGELRSLTEKVAAGAGKAISVISMSGLLMKSQSSMGGTSTVSLRREIRAAAGDSEVGAILLRVDSPGGTSAGTFDLASEVKAAAKKKLVWAQVEDLAASAAVWAISGASQIFANSPTALYGSIGTYQILQDTSAADEKLGMRTILVATGPLKGMGVEGTKITDSQVAHVQGLVNSIQESFDAAVQKGRNLTAKQLAAVRHGGVMSAAAAQEAGLIDGVQSISKTISDLTAAMKSGESPRKAMNFDMGSEASVGSFPTLEPLERHGLPTLTNTEQ